MENRDKRFDLNFYVHGDTVGALVLNLCKLRRHYRLTVYIIRTYLPDGASKDNLGTTAYCDTYLRLADIYLTYAEAAFESTGSYTTSLRLFIDRRASSKCCAITCRTTGCSHNTTSYENNILPYSEETSLDEPFRLLYRNERAVEMAFEGTYWFDLRRWKRAHLKDGSPLETLMFDLAGGSTDVAVPIDNETIMRVSAEANGTYTFKEQHYWMPFRDDLTYFSKDWEQNPGW